MPLGGPRPSREHYTRECEAITAPLWTVCALVKGFCQALCRTIGRDCSSRALLQSQGRASSRGSPSLGEVLSSPPAHVGRHRAAPSKMLLDSPAYVWLAPHSCCRSRPGPPQQHRAAAQPKPRPAGPGFLKKVPGRALERERGPQVAEAGVRAGWGRAWGAGGPQQDEPGGRRRERASHTHRGARQAPRKPLESPTQCSRD